MACTQPQTTPTRPESNIMKEPEAPSNAFDSGYESTSSDLEHDGPVSEAKDIPSISKPLLWQTPRRRSSSCHTLDDAMSHYDGSSTSSSSSSSSKYNSDYFDSEPSTGTHSPATSWSSHCDEACEHRTKPSSSLPPPPQTTTTKDVAAETEQQHTSSSLLQEATSRKNPGLSIDTTNLPPWDAMFPDWYQCASPGPIRQLGASWAALKDTNMQGMWAPPPPPPAAGGLWGM